MMKLRKYVLLLALVGSCFAFTACGKEEQKEEVQPDRIEIETEESTSAPVTDEEGNAILEENEEVEITEEDLDIIE